MGPDQVGSFLTAPTGLYVVLTHEQLTTVTMLCNIIVLQSLFSSA